MSLGLILLSVRNSLLEVQGDSSGWPCFYSLVLKGTIYP